MASLNRLSTNTPAPSPITKPFARASKGDEWVGESAPIAENFAKVAGSMVRSVAPASITSTCRVCSKRHASKTAAIDEAQAASMAWLGPCKSRRLATRPETTFASSPGMVSSSIRGVPSSIASVNAGSFVEGIPCSLASVAVWLDHTRRLDRFRFSPPKALAKTTPVLVRSMSLASPSYPACSMASAETDTAHNWHGSI